MIDPKALRIGNWIHCKGSSHYCIVTGELLALLEKEEKMREKFEYIELSGELLEAAGFQKTPEFDIWRLGQFDVSKDSCWWWSLDDRGDNEGTKFRELKNLSHLQNIYFDTERSELPLPESAKRINQAVEK